MFNKLLILAGIGTYTYYNYMSILKWANQCYRWFIKIECLNPSYVNRVVRLNNKVYYYITLKGRQFITIGKEYDVEKYKLFSKKMTIPNGPDNILEADITTINGETIDVLDDIKMLCGPYVNQCTQENRDWLFNYIADEYTEVKGISDIEKLSIELINGDTIKLT